MVGKKVLAIAAALSAFACLFAAPAAAQAPATLTGETLAGSPNQVNVTCQGSGEGDFTIQWDVSGVASGPYPGTFRETGSHIGPGFDVIHVDFAIDSPAGSVTGTKTFVPDNALSETCMSTAAGSFGILLYEATIATSAGRFSDEGTADSFVFSTAPGSGTGIFTETFVSDLTEPVPLPGPTSTDQCKRGGWQEFGFKNQGQCIAFVNHGP